MNATKEEERLNNNELVYEKKMQYYSKEDSIINNETQIDSICSDSYIQSKDLSIGQNSTILSIEKPKKKTPMEKKQKKKKKKIPIMLDEFKEEIEKMVDKQFEEEYSKINKEYDEKLEELLIEQEKIFNKNEMLKAKYNALEKYVKNYCKKANIDYDNLLSQ